MADEADIANDAILADMERRIQAQRAAANRPPVDNCEECEEPIASGRRDLGLRVCLDCAVLRERTARIFRKG